MTLMVFHKYSLRWKLSKGLSCGLMCNTFTQNPTHTVCLSHINNKMYLQHCFLAPWGYLCSTSLNTVNNFTSFVIDIYYTSVSDKILILHCAMFLFTHSQAVNWILDTHVKPKKLNSSRLSNMASKTMD